MAYGSGSRDALLTPASASPNFFPEISANLSRLRHRKVQRSRPAKARPAFAGQSRTEKSQLATQFQLVNHREDIDDKRVRSKAIDIICRHAPGRAHRGVSPRFGLRGSQTQHRRHHGDDIGIWTSVLSRGMMAGRTPNLDQIAAEG